MFENVAFFSLFNLMRTYNTVNKDGKFLAFCSIFDTEIFLLASCKIDAALFYSELIFNAVILLYISLHNHLEAYL